ncbi:MAG: 16S rRNA (cytosine(967)-C(5))-methyltransferase RsmB [bacterium]|nr:16S rRNA (cytosine(967)-C(5))-methyltransferase RsmB [bacterium]
MKRRRPEARTRRSDAEPDARGVALDVLLRVERGDAWADVLLGHRLAETALAPEDRALATTLVYGVLAWRGRLDHHLAALVRDGLERLDPPVLAALRLGLFQLLFLERVPAFAAVDTSVTLARRRGAGAAGLVNAVLRRVVREGAHALPLPDAAADPIGRLAVELSHPRWLVARWADELGLDALPALLAADNRAGEIVLRTNRLRTDAAALAATLAAEGVQVAPARFDPDALVVAAGAGRLRHGNLARKGGSRSGRSVAAGRAAGRAAAERARARRLCGAGRQDDAAGGAGRRRRYGRGPRPARRRRAPHRGRGDGCCAHGARRGRRRAAALRPGFDAVLVDAPCSGLGTLRRHPEARWRRTAADPSRLAALQRALLAGVAPLVRPGGTLVYAVCTIMRAETDDVLAAFLGDHPGFAVEPATAVLPAAAHALVDPAGLLRTHPHRDDLDGFFAVRLRAPH